ncbi:MAG: AAA family ATPase [Acidithiobacillus sp.]
MSVNPQLVDQRSSPLIIFTVGTAASGKSSWAKSMQEQYASLQVTILERDMIRVALYQTEQGGEFSWNDWNSAWEGKVQKLWEERLLKVLKTSAVIILADTHLDVADLRKKTAWLREQGAHDFVLKYFPPLPLTELLRRDQGRGHPVGGEALREHIKKIASEELYWEAIERA